MSVHERFESLLLVLAIGSSVAIMAKRFSIPYNVALVIVGLFLVFTDVLPKAPLNPEMILVAFLPVLVFEGALFADADAMRSARRPILALAAPGVAISLLSTAAIATFALKLDFPTALLLGALLAITDTVSVLLAFRSVRAPHRLTAIMEGESLFNDGTALVFVSLATTVVITGHFDPVAILGPMAKALIGGVAVGAAFGAVGSLVLRRTPDHLTAILASAVLVFATSLLADRMDASPVIAVVVVGLTIGRAARRHLEPSRVLALQGFWETAGFGLNVLLFLLVGMQLQASSLIKEFSSIALALVALHAGRAVAVYGCFGIMRPFSGEKIPMRWQHVMVVGNVKGALSMAAVLALPQGLPNRDRLVTIVFGVTFATLVMQALPFRRILNLLNVTLAGTDADLDLAKASLIAARCGQTQLDELLSSGLISRNEHAERRAAYQRFVIGAEELLRGPSGIANQNHWVDAALLEAQKMAVLDAARRGLISGDAADAHVHDLDRAVLDLVANSPKA